VAPTYQDRLPPLDVPRSSLTPPPPSISSPAKNPSMFSKSRPSIKPPGTPPLPPCLHSRENVLDVAKFIIGVPHTCEHRQPIPASSGEAAASFWPPSTLYSPAHLPNLLA
jgi:hypothetical protein